MRHRVHLHLNNNHLFYLCRIINKDNSSNHCISGDRCHIRVQTVISGFTRLRFAECRHRRLIEYE
jgi:hypothetical protein